MNFRELSEGQIENLRVEIFAFHGKRRDLYSIDEWEGELAVWRHACNIKREGRLYDDLCALFTSGPLEDGDIPSKSGRDSLVHCGMAVRTICKGEWGYNSCTNLGGHVWKMVLAINEALTNRQAITP